MVNYEKLFDIRIPDYETLKYAMRNRLAQVIVSQYKADMLELAQEIGSQFEKNYGKLDFESLHLEYNRILFYYHRRKFPLIYQSLSVRSK